MQKNKLLNAIGMAYSSRNLTTGSKLLDQIKENKIELVIISSNMGLSQKKKFIDKCNSRNIEYISDLITKEELSKACGKAMVVAVGLKDPNFIKLIKSTL
ncbi:ribosomal L7Ae/L30e/S12e/Gadd45 family protein [Vibrio harveyi]|nr:ribosomal L7Ae/L30e/S12e/Gadd45 family protein [Vibrio harveyi]